MMTSQQQQARAQALARIETWKNELAELRGRRMQSAIELAALDRMKGDPHAIATARANELANLRALDGGIQVRETNIATTQDFLAGVL